MPFRIDPLAFVRDNERDFAVAALRDYCQVYTGRAFERLIERAAESPNEITGWDIAAVRTLSVTLPPRAIVELTGELAEEVEQQLCLIPAEQRIWHDDVDFDDGGPAMELWRMIKAFKGMGRTKTSKLLAAKRPHLIPVYDTYVGAALLRKKADNDWVEWRTYMRGSSGLQLRDAAKALKGEAGAASSMSVLRTLDIVIWMRVWGWRDSTDPCVRAAGECPLPGDTRG